MSAPHLPGLERNCIVAASAGTGKTHLITNIYIAHVLGLRSDGEEIAPERIVATTFSRAAAREIRERLEQRLHAIAFPAEAVATGLDPTLASVAELRGLSRSTLEKRAATALELLPRTLIDTLHGLATRVLRGHALEFGIAPGFSILDEQEALEDATSTIEDVLSQALAEGPEREAAVTAFIDAGLGLEATITSLMATLSLLDEEGLDAADLLLPAHDADARGLYESLEHAAAAVLAAGASHPLASAARAVQLGLRALPETEPLSEALGLFFKDKRPQLERMENGRAVLDALDALLRPKDSKAERIRKSVGFLARAPQLLSQERELRTLLARVQREVLARRRARNAFGFGDLLRLARDALRDAPAIAVEASGALDLLLVDEFQDTSRVQRDLVLLLHERAESARRRAPGALPKPTDLRSRGLVVVGDRKQSIYAFRGADVSIYARLAAELAGAAAVSALDIHGIEPNPEPVAEFVSLKQNYRSAPPILDFVNRVARVDFSQTPKRSFEIRYMEAEELSPPPSRAGVAGRVTFITDDGALPEAPDALLAGAKGPLRTALIAAGFCAKAHDEGQEYRDLALLARRRSSLPLLELALDRLKIPFVVAGRALYATQEVRDLAALLRLSLDPYDRHALATVARGALGGLSDRALAELSVPQRGLLVSSQWARVELGDAGDSARCRALAERLSELYEIAPRLSPRDVLSLAIERFELESVLGALPRGAVRFGNVGRLLEIAARRGGSLPQFSRWLERQIALEVDESEAATFSEEDDAVRLLTVHGSKGLSFPVTIVVDVNATEPARSQPFGLLRSDHAAPTLTIRYRADDGLVQSPALARINDDAQARALSERQRLSYVALTRAERELVLVLPAEAPRAGSLGRSVAELLLLDPELPVQKLPALELLQRGPTPFEPDDASEAVPLLPARAPWQGAAIGVTALSDYALCARRFQLLHVAGISEFGSAQEQRGDEASDTARAIGSAAHQVLESYPVASFGETASEPALLELLAATGLDREAKSTRETAAGIGRFLASDYAREVREHGKVVHREVEMTLVIDESRRARPVRQLELFHTPNAQHRSVLRATLDLVVERDDGSIDVIDYKRSRGGDPTRYALQLHAYRLAVEQRFGEKKIRTGLINLLAPSAEPVWVNEPPPRELAELMALLAESRYRAHYPPIQRARCVSARCGFVTACHPRTRAH
ncbi:MAG TPA: UvrD-helicase domain-containing protein [Polyangiaceae bacterium]|nr:UvrD-helicase domain-containing protein [Polyangiaceae bacterium]